MGDPSYSLKWWIGLLPMCILTLLWHFFKFIVKVIEFFADPLNRWVYGEGSPVRRRKK